MFIILVVFSAGRRISPGAIGAVPEIMPSEVLKVTIIIL